jgi:hypothetical protein
MGNKFIFESLIECHVSNRLTKDDTVIIMWSSWHREDRYKNDGWMGCGNVYNAEPLYDKAFLKSYWDDKGAILDSMNWVAAAIQLLEGLGCHYTMTFLQFDPVIGLPTEYNIDTGNIDMSAFKKYSDFIAEYRDKFVYQDLWGWQPKYPQVKPIYWNVVWNKGPWIDVHPQPSVFSLWITRYLNQHITHLNIDLDNIKQTAEYCEIELVKMSPDYQLVIDSPVSELTHLMANKAKYGSWKRV